MTIGTPSATTGRSLLLTATGEAYQPVRLYYSVPTKVEVTRVLRALHCVVADGSGGWLWQYEGEASGLGFARRRDDLPHEIHPIVLGRFHFPSKNGVVLAVRSCERAIAAAKFFGPLFGRRVVLRRVRTINRLFAGSEVVEGLHRLDASLDNDVVRIDPKETEAAIEAALAGARSPEEKREAYLAYREQLRRRDVPLVEDFPLAPEEETEDFADLAAALQFRQVRAYRHWMGDTHLTLADVIHEVVEQGFADGLMG